MSTPVENNADTSHVEPDDIGVGMLTVLGLLCAVSLFLIVVLLQAWFYNWKDDLEAQRTASTEEHSAPAALAAEQLKQIDIKGHVDPANKSQVCAVPINRAMELIVGEYGAKSDGTTDGGKKQ
jgi:hypothetical protein